MLVHPGAALVTVSVLAGLWLTAWGTTLITVRTFKKWSGGVAPAELPAGERAHVEALVRREHAHLHYVWMLPLFPFIALIAWLRRNGKGDAPFSLVLPLAAPFYYLMFAWWLS